MIPVARIPTGGGPHADLYVAAVDGYRPAPPRADGSRPTWVDVLDHLGRWHRLPTWAVLIDTNRIDSDITDLGAPCSTI